MDLIVFAGTSEGRRLYDFCAERRIDALFCVATDYGRETLCAPSGVSSAGSSAGGDAEPSDHQHMRELCKPKIRVGRMEAKDMETLFRTENPRLVIDATHPYAVQATENIQAAVERYVRAEGAEKQLYCRVRRETREREEASAESSVERFADMAQAIDYLNGTRGNVLVATGSREMDTLCKLDAYAERAYVRILPNPDILQAFLDRGFPPGHMICMQGPFTEELNLALMRQCGIRYLLTKQSGAAGGYPEKRRAAQEAGVKLLVLQPPREDAAGCSVEEAQEMILERLAPRGAGGSMRESAAEHTGRKRRL